MTTYNTINEAFKNGSGDVFFTKNGSFVALSRHANPYDEMKAQGFTFLTYDQVMELAKAQQPIAETVAPAPVPTKAEAPKKFINYTDQEVWGYYLEFPDAYGQHL